MSKLGVGGPGDGASGRGDDDESEDAEALPQFRDVVLDIDPADPWYTVAVPRLGWRARAPVLVRDVEP